MQSLTRRDFLSHSLAAGTLATGLLHPQSLAAQTDNSQKRPRVAVILTWMTHLSHAHVLMENFLNPVLFNGQLVDPGVDVVSMYVDQFPPERDMAREVAESHKIPLYDSIRGALTQGGKTLDVDAVLSIGEHGEYEKTKYGIDKYPRKEWFDECVRVMQESGRLVPYFNDKHFSYRWDWAKEMYDTAREIGLPFMAGSSVPLAQRKPDVTIEPGTELVEALSIHGGPIERYDFHGAEVLQSMIEYRKGGETGITKLEVLKGDDVEKAGRAGRFSWDLYEAAMKAELGKVPEKFGVVPGEGEQPVHGIFLEYKDGLKATILRIGRTGIRWNFAWREKQDDTPHATYFYPGPWNNRNLFKALAHAIQTFFRTRQSPYPVERTLLTTGITEAVVRSYYEEIPLKTPHLEIAYQPTDYTALRERGASWKILTEEMPSPPGMFNPTGLLRE
ncbi:MAG TPA: hypothetical protein VLA12_14435 [Planctomycetaceae bacterium]|nr:hypothetical protein [Planctomycetaceae bacterium]